MDNNTTKGGNWELMQTMQPFLQQAWHKFAFKSPTAIQQQAMPLILTGKDVIAESPTGTGKTLAYLLPLLHMLDPEKKGAQAVVIAPSHELAMQIYQTIQMWTKGSDITSAPFIGGANIKGQLANLKKHPQIIVGTTGRLLELIKMRKLKMHQVKTIVVDEFDVLIAQEHVDNLKSIIKTTLKERQLLFFSATLSERTEQIAQELMQQPHIVQIQSMGDTAPKAEHLYLLCEQREKIEMIPKIMRLGKVKALVFINDLSKIPEIEAKLKYNGMSLGVLTGETKKNERQLAMNNFRQGKISLLVATDLAARGLDIEGVTHVINWDLPTSPNQYIHRAGRTARMGATGTVISIVTKGEENILKRITGKLDVAIKKKRLYKGKMFDSK